MRRFAATLLIATIGTAPAAAQSVPASADGSSLTSYRINPGDELEVFVWGEERLQRVVRVLPDGTFSFPLVGRVQAAGQLPGDIEKALTRGLVGQYSGAVPQVTVSVRTPAGLQFSVIGKVRNPGTFTPGRYVNALEALSIAGGATEFAQLGNVIIIRKDGGRVRSFKLRLTEVLKGNPSAEDLDAIPQIQSGDTVVVP